MEAVFTVSFIRGVGMYLEATDVSCGIIVAKGNDIPKNVSNSSGAGSVCVVNVEGL